MLPFRPLNWPTLVEMLNVSYNDVRDVNYSRACEAPTVRETMVVLDSLGISLRSSTWVPTSFFLRPAEAIDAIRQYSLSSMSSHKSSSDVAYHVLCGVTFSGGILYLLIVVPSVDFDVYVHSTVLQLLDVRQ